MFGLEILDVVIGLMFVYLLLSLLATAINEYISAVLNLRGRELARGLGRLLDDLDEKDAVRNALDGVGKKITTTSELLTEQFYNHRLIRPYATRRGRFGRFLRWVRRKEERPRLPSYIPARTFALALLDILGVDDKDAKLEKVFPVPAGKTLAQAVAEAEQAALTAEAAAKKSATPENVKAAAEARLRATRGKLAHVLAILQKESDVELTEHLTTLSGLPQADKLAAQLQVHVAGLLTGAQTQLQKLHDSVEVWFNNSMDRVSGAYKRHVQGWLFVIGLVIATCMNADTIDMWRRLEADDELRNAMVRRAEATVAALDTTLADSAAAARQDTVPAPDSLAETPAAPAVTDSAPADPPQAVARTGRAAADTTVNDSASLAAVEQARKNYLASRARLDSMELKLGWTRDEAMRIGWIKADSSYKGAPARRAPFNLPFLAKVLGLLLTTLAISLGAPFWFDLLNKVVSIRGAGRSPEEKPKSPEGGPKRAAERAPK